MTTSTIPTDGEIALDNRVQDALQQSPFFSNRRLRFETQEGRVVLRGTVASYYQKQMAQETLRGLEGICHIENQLVVAWT
jgi:osmotically-inducible protein OsmY